MLANNSQCPICVWITNWNSRNLSKKKKLICCCYGPKMFLTDALTGHEYRCFKYFAHLIIYRHIHSSLYSTWLLERVKLLTYDCGLPEVGSWFPGVWCLQCSCLVVARLSGPCAELSGSRFLGLLIIPGSPRLVLVVWSSCLVVDTLGWL